MSAKEELIAAALAQCDVIAGMLGYEPSSLRDMRELCARAMVQPDIAEVERLADEYANAVHDGRDNDCATVRAALLDYVRGVMAERDALIQTLRDEIDENLRLRELGGALPDENITAMTERLIRERDQFRDAAKMVADPLSLSRILHELAGAASLCWEPRPTGVFDSQLAIHFVEQALAEIRSRMAPASAGVPIPDVHDYGYLDSDNGWVETLACDESDVHTYGDAREAAGYARGKAAGGKDAERYQHAKLHGWPEYRCEIHPNPNGVPQWGYCGYWFDSPDAAIDAALRGEVKP